MKKLSDSDRFFLIALYKKQIDRWGLQRWLRHSKAIVKAAHQRLESKGTR
jgi:hypothetical protein